MISSFVNQIKNPVQIRQEHKDLSKYPDMAPGWCSIVTIKLKVYGVHQKIFQMVIFILWGVFVYWEKLTKGKGVPACENRNKIAKWYFFIFPWDFS